MMEGRGAVFWLENEYHNNYSHHINSRTVISLCILLSFSLFLSSGYVAIAALNYPTKFDLLN